MRNRSRRYAEHVARQFIDAGVTSDVQVLGTREKILDYIDEAISQGIRYSCVINNREFEREGTVSFKSHGLNSRRKREYFCCWIVS